MHDLTLFIGAFGTGFMLAVIFSAFINMSKSD